MEGIWLVSYVALWLLLLALGVVVVSLMRNLGLLAMAVRQLQSGTQDTLLLEAGAPAPELPLTTLDGQPTSLAAHGGAPVALMVISPGCGPCHDLLQSLRDGHAPLPELPAATRQLLVSLGDETATRALLADAPFVAGPVLLADAVALKERWGVQSTPTTVLLDVEGRYLRHQMGFSASVSGHSQSALRQDVTAQA